MAKYYITTTLPYVNSEPHLGFAMEIVRADVLARWHRLTGDEVFFNTGTDEHGQKIYQKAVEQERDTQEYVDYYAGKFRQLKEVLNLSVDNFIRTTDQHHQESAQEMWRRCKNNGDIYKKMYRIKYCIGCELEKTDSELVDGKCPIHKHLDLQIIEEENYFFKFSKYQEDLLKLYREKINFVIPEWRQLEMIKFVEGGLQDFSISRLKSKMPWGVEVPDDDEQVMFVWFDALTNYISALGWPSDDKKFKEFWPGNQICGKDNLRQQTAMWQAMLISAGLEPSRQIYVEGFITSGGQKMSKSLGNVIDPVEYVEKYGIDALRYFLLAKLHPYEDSDVTPERFEEVYNSDLANGLGNLVARVAAMADDHEFDDGVNTPLKLSRTVEEALQKYRFDLAMGEIWEKIKKSDTLINERKVWKLEGDDRKTSLNELVENIRQIAVDLKPFLPETAEKIGDLFGGSKIVKQGALFPRLEK